MVFERVTTNDTMDDKNIKRQVRTLYVQGNQVIGHMTACNYEVKVIILKYYCTNMNATHLWHSCR